ncbi:MAG: hypothetical protein WC931_06035, partial [Bacilli bacterium]
MKLDIAYRESRLSSVAAECDRLGSLMFEEELMSNRVPLVRLSVIALVVASLMGCAEVNVGAPGDTETGSDTGSDSDSDTDIDTDSDSDTDTDADTDTDTDTDTDGDTDPVSCDDEGDCGGDPCVDGYCCDGPCAGTCEACDVAGSEGTCTAYAAGGDPDEECAAAEPTSCGLDGTCDGASACAYFGGETACDDEQVCTEDDACDGAGGCAGVASTACDPGPGDECCAGACSDILGCYTEVEGCEEACTGASLTVGQTCVGCGPANAEGVCTGGTTVQCTSASHTQCAEQACGGVAYYCTNDGGTWAWRTAIACDDGNACTYDDSCFGGDCLATTYGCTSDACMDRECDGEGACDETPIPDAECGTTACPPDDCTGGDWQDYGATCTNSCSDSGECETCSCAATPTDCTVGAGNECCETACSPSGGCYTASGSCGGADACADVNTKIVGSVCTGCGTNGAAGTCEGGGTFTCGAGTHTPCQNVSCGGTTYYCTNTGGVWQWRTSPGCDDLDACSYGDTCGSGGCAGVGITCTDTACLLSDCDGTSACDETALSSSTTCGTTTCPADSCGVGVWYNYPASCTSTCSGDGACDTCACTATSTTCAAGPSNVCCTASCDAVGGCATAAGSCAAADACGDANTLYYAKTCTGCGLNGANGACGGGSTAVCNGTTHTPCQRVTCGGTVYRCTNLGGIWQWRSGTGCDDGNPCSYGDVCNASDVCDGTDITCLSTTCVDRTCNGTSSCTVSYPSGSSCDDGNLCTYGTTCNGGAS